MSWTAAFWFLLLFAVGKASEPEARSSCAEHFLYGQSKDSVLPVGYGSDVYYVECVMPKLSNSFPNLPVETVIHTSLEKSYELMNKDRTIGYQISNWNFLKAIVESQECDQTIEIDWTPISHDKSQGFRIESISGKVREFVANTTGINPTVNLSPEGGLAGILHLRPTGNATFNAKIKASPLRCREKIVKEKDCEFELNSAQDRVLIATSEAKEVSFSFRTDKANSGFLRLLDINGNAANIYLRDGYMIGIDDIQYPIPIHLLADGNFHGVKLNLKNKFIQIDGKYPQISFDLKYLKSPIKQVGIMINGTVTAIRLDDTYMHCNNSRYLTVKSSAAVLRRFCPAGEASYCNCKAPSSVFGSVDPKCKPQTELNEAFTLKREANKISFFYFGDFQFTQSISTVFQSDAYEGLIFFGQRKSAGTGFERFQVYYVDGEIIAGSCLKDGKEQFSCRSCKINYDIPNNNWIRVSLMNSSSYLMMTVNDQICQLSTKYDHFKPHHFYKGPESESYLFVGGTYYKEEMQIGQNLVNRDFKNKFLDFTSQKPLSIRGCIAEVRFDGKDPIDLEKHFNNQSTQILSNPSSRSDVFAVESGCEECSLECGTSTCVIRSGKQQICDCGHNFSGHLNEYGICIAESSAYSLRFDSVDSTPIVIKIDPGLQRVMKFWTFLRLPHSTGSKPVELISFSRFSISVLDNGRKVLISSAALGIRKQFDVDSYADERLSLIAIEYVPALYSSRFRQQIRFRVNSQVQYGEAIPGSIISNEFDVKINPIKNSTQFGGCLEGLYFSLDNDAEGTSNLRIINVNERLSQENDVGRLQLHRGETCGIFEPTVWRHSSSPLGFVSDYDPTGRNQAASHIEDGSFPWILIILLIIVCIFLFCLLIAFLYHRHSKHTYKILEKKAKNTAVIEEVCPLVQDGQANVTPSKIVVSGTTKEYQTVAVSKQQKNTQPASIVNNEDL